jgi:hypothetical protein
MNVAEAALRRRVAAILGVALNALALPVLADVHFRDFSDPDAPTWAEKEVALPGYPKDPDLVEFAVTASRARFFVDGSSISPSAEGVVRYVLLIRTGGGATNVSFEGMRCETGQYRIYASGRADGSWARSRSEDWRPIEKTTVNSYRATLSHDFFCPVGVPINSAEEGRDALRRGAHPLVPGMNIRGG